MKSILRDALVEAVCLATIAEVIAIGAVVLSVWAYFELIRGVVS